MATRSMAIKLALSVGLLLASALLTTGPLLGRSLEEIRQSGKLVMLTFPHQDNVFVRTNVELGAMPRSGSAEHFVGIDVELVKAFADAMELELEIRPVSEPRYGALIPDLLAGRGDLIASSFSITDTRRQSVDFSRPYYTVHNVVVTKTADSQQPTKLSDLESLVGSVNGGSSHDEYLLGLGIDADKIVRMDFSVENYLAVIEDRADYALVDSTSAERFLSQLPELSVAFKTPVAVDYGIAIERDSALKAQLDAFLDDFATKGKLTALIERHQQEFALSQQADDD